MGDDKRLKRYEKYFQPKETIAKEVRKNVENPQKTSSSRKSLFPQATPMTGIANQTPTICLFVPQSAALRSTNPLALNSHYTPTRTNEELLLL